MLIKGSNHQDSRGLLTFNNDFDASLVKRVYTIENFSTDFIRGWQGHRVEQRWFACMKGSFEIQTIELDNFENPSEQLNINTYLLTEKTLDILHVTSGHLTSIRALERQSKLLVMADYAVNEIQDEYRFPLDYFKNF